jgi:glycosyltransferase involved in cell wall biosynthesis
MSLPENKEEIRTIAVCAAQVPFRRGGAEEHVDSLVRELKKRGFKVDHINLPYKWYPHEKLFQSIQMWKMLDLSESDGERIDLIITTKFPSYFAEHPNRVLWLIHQYRQAYDLFNTPFSGFDPQNKKEMETRERFIKMDTGELKKYGRIYTNSQNTANRLKKFNDISSTPLYHPPKHAGKYFNAGFENFILSAGRLSPLKRMDILIRSLQFCDPQVSCKIAGTGPERERLEHIAEELGVHDRVEFLGYIPDEELLDLYARCQFVFFAPLDEDYGYITLEAFLSEKPVITCFDAGGPLEFVENGVNGIVLSTTDEREIAPQIESLFFDTDTCREFGKQGFQKVKDINWDHVIKTLIHG